MRTVFWTTLAAASATFVVPAYADEAGKSAPPPPAPPAVTAVEAKPQQPLKADVEKVVKDVLKAEKEKKDKEDLEKGVLKVKWDNGLKLESADKKFKFKFTGRVLIDYWGFDDEVPGTLVTGVPGQPGVGDFDSGVFFRRARLGIEMEFMKHGWARFEYDFARGGNAQAGFADAFVGFKDIDDCWCGFPNVRIGHMFEPFGLESATSTRCTTFLERSLIDSMYAGRNTGIEFSNAFCNDRVFYQVGAFHQFSNNFGDGIFNEDPSTAGNADPPDGEFVGDDDGWAVSGRLAALPWISCTCPDRRFLHAGLSYGHRDDLRSVRYRARPEVGIGPRVVDTANFEADSVDQFGAELAFLWDRWHLSAEYYRTEVESTPANDPSYWGGYVEVGWFLTGESRGYNKQWGRWDCIKPTCPFLGNECCGWGAWQVAVRMSHFDLRDGNDATTVGFGGHTHVYNAALNWYPYANMRFQLNYVHAEVDDFRGRDAVDGTVDAIGIRATVWW